MSFAKETETSLMGPVFAVSMNGYSLDALRKLLLMISADTFAAVFETLSTFEWWSDLTLFLPTATGDRREATLQLPDPRMLTLAVWRHGPDSLGLIIKHGAPPWHVIYQDKAECSHTPAEVYDLFASMGSLQ